jgi:hypothetical protein
MSMLFIDKYYSKNYPHVSPTAGRDMGHPKPNKSGSFRRRFVILPS